MDKGNVIIFGSPEAPIYAMNDDSILTLDTNMSCSLTGDELVVDTLECEFRLDRLPVTFCPAGYSAGMTSYEGLPVNCRTVGDDFLASVPYATPVYYYHNERFVAKFFVDTIVRTGPDAYKVSAVSAVGLLDRMTFYGGYFHKKPIWEVITIILLTDGLDGTYSELEYEIFRMMHVNAEAVQNLTVTGWIPICSKREALHAVLFSHNLYLRRYDAEGYLLSWIMSGEATPIEDARLYSGGSVTTPSPCQLLEVTEHGYRAVIDENERKVLFDNSDVLESSRTIVRFGDAPIDVDSLQTTGSIVIAKASANACVATGIGTITGIPMLHTENIVSRGNRTDYNGMTVSVTDNYLICTDNSELVADKLWNYYTKRKEISQDIVLAGELITGQYSFRNAHGEPTDCYLQGMKISGSKTAKATCEFIAGFEPPGGGASFSRSVLLTGSGTWTVPAEVFAKANPIIRVIIIGGGQGGSSGYRAADGKKARFWNDNSHSAEDIGRNGEFGQPGRVYQITIRGSDIAPSYVFSCGAGGAGAVGGCDSRDTPNLGQVGSVSRFGAYSSDMGTVHEDGIVDFFSGRILAAQNNRLPEYQANNLCWTLAANYETYDDGTSSLVYEVVNGGGQPSIVDMAASNLEITQYLADGQKQTLDFLGAPPLTPYFHRVSSSEGWSDVWDGASGGSAAGNPGNRGEYGTETIMYADGSIRMGDGGNGADATAAPPDWLTAAPGYYGFGGFGGFGGGQGGNTGCNAWIGSWSLGIVDGVPGRGGKGGPGGKGGDGCILIYY